MNFDLLSDRQKSYLAAARAIADSPSFHVWLVGGPVRDLLLGRAAGDLDFVLEQDAEQFTTLVADRLGGIVRSFPRFGTFKIILPDGDEVDVTSARTESYERPGALPTVVPAPLSRDLARRDFTLNALALDLRNDEIVDTTGGAEDLNRGLLRVIHDASFDDDPTRLFRGARLAVRLGFALESHTGELLEQAVRKDAWSTVSRERIWREILLALREPSPGGTLSEFLRRGLLDHFLRLDESTPSPEEIVLAGEAVRADVEVDAKVALLGCLLAGNSWLSASLDGASLRENERKKIEQVAASIRSLARASIGVADNELWEMARRLPDEALVVAGALPGADTARLGRLLRCRHHPVPVEPAGGIGSGRHIGKAIAAARLALFTGEIAEETVTAFARAKALQYLSEQA